MSMDPLNNSPSLTTDFDYFQSPIFQTLDPTVQADLISTFSSQELNRLFPIGDNIPLLLPPADELQNSILDFFGTLQDTARQFRNQLAISRGVDLLSRAHIEALAAATAAVAETYAKSSTSGKEKGEDVKDKLEDVDEQVDTQNDEVSDVNNGASNEKSRAQTQINNYNTFVSQLTSMGAVYKGQDANGNDIYEIPGGTDPAARTSAYNAAAQTYSTQTSSYNTYWQTRGQEILDYNSATATYNSQATSNTNYLQGVLDDYDLRGEMQNLGYTSAFTQPQATLRDASNIPGSANFPNPSQLSNPTYPVTITAGRPPTWVYAKASASVSSLQVPSISYPNLTEDDLKKIASKISKEVALILITLNIPLDLLLAAYARNLTAAGVYDKNDVSDQSVIDESLQSPRKRIYPQAPIDIYQSAGTTASRGAGGLTSIALTRSEHIALLMGKALVALVLHNENLDQETIDSISSQAQLLAFNFIQANAAQALFPSLGPLSNVLSTLPANSPAFTLLFSISLANRLIESTQQGELSQALQTLINANPSLASISQEQLDSLTAALNTGILLVAAELIATNLGIPEILAPILSSLVLSDTFTDAKRQALIEEAITDRLNALGDLRIELENNFRAQQFAKEEAAFLAIQAAIVRSSLLDPTPSTITSTTINQEALSQSVQAALVASGVPLTEAVGIVQNALTRVLEGEFASSAEFRKNLERSLSRLEVEKEIAKTAADQAVIIAPKPAEIASLEELLLLTSRLTDTTLATSEIYAILAKRLMALLLGGSEADLAKLITEELAKTLFGTPNPVYADKADLKAPLSLVNQIKSQIANIRVADEEKYTEALANVFKETIKPSIELNAFLEKIMDPAYYFLYVLSQSSLMNAKRDTPTVLV